MPSDMNETHTPTSYEEGYSEGIRAARAEWRAKLLIYERGDISFVEAFPPADPKDGPTVEVGCFELPKFYPPPWIAFDRGDGMIDVLPMGRPGTVMMQVPKRMGHKLILLANSFAKTETTMETPTTPLPPWTLMAYTDNSGYADILTATGHQPVLHNLPETLARAIVIAANSECGLGRICPKCLMPNFHRLGGGPRLDCTYACPDCGYSEESSDA